MAKKNLSEHFMLCVKNDGYPASLEVRKIYRAIPDSTASSKGFVRVVDESGEDYLYPSGNFIAVDLPKAAVEALRAAS